MKGEAAYRAGFEAPEPVRRLLAWKVAASLPVVGQTMTIQRSQ